MDDDFAELRVGDRTIQLPIVVETEGERAIDITKLRDETGYITLDPGYANTARRSAITFIDGEKGILRYRGYPIEELASRSTFLEVAYLLTTGELPTAKQLKEFTTLDHVPHDAARGLQALLRLLAEGRASDGGVFGSRGRARDLLPRLARPARSAPCRDLGPPPDRQVPDAASYSYKHSIGQPFMFPDNRLAYVGNFLRSCSPPRARSTRWTTS